MGALVGGLVTIFGSFKLDEHQRDKRRAKLQSALAVEISSLIELAEHQKYASHLREFAEHLEQLDDVDYPTLHINASSGYFTVYEGNSGDVGELDMSQAADIIAFYQQARSLLDSVTKDGSPDPRYTSKAEAAEHYRELATRIDLFCDFGRGVVEQLSAGAIRDRIAKNARALFKGANVTNDP